MPNTYKIGHSTADIKLTVEITTLGLAASIAEVLVLTSADPGEEVAHSDDASGDIPEQAIGSAGSLKGKRLGVRTQISLTGDDVDAQKQQLGNFKGTYTLSGGDDGAKTYDNPTIITESPVADVVLLFIVDLT